MMKMKAMSAMILALVLMVELVSIAEAANCNPVQLSPCLPAIMSNTKPSLGCCTRLNDQKPCLCQYVRNPNLKEYVNSPGARNVANSCGVTIPNC
ncbi:unnamed protein product [Lathyrus sativus]|nr:unnamed protein product [Lathyrus sativus]